LQRAEGDFAAPVRSNDYRRWPAEIETLAIPDVASTIGQRPTSLQLIGVLMRTPPRSTARPIGEYSAA